MDGWTNIYIERCVYCTYAMLVACTHIFTRCQSFKFLLDVRVQVQVHARAFYKTNIAPRASPLDGKGTSPVTIEDSSHSEVKRSRNKRNSIAFVLAVLFQIISGFQIPIAHQSPANPLVPAASLHKHGVIITIIAAATTAATTAAAAAATVAAAAAAGCITKAPCPDQDSVPCTAYSPLLPVRAYKNVSFCHFKRSFLRHVPTLKYESSELRKGVSINSIKESAIYREDSAGGASTILYWGGGRVGAPHHTVSTRGNTIHCLYHG